MLELSAEAVTFEPVSNLSDIFFDDVNQKVCTVRGGGAMGVTVVGPAPRDIFSCRLKDKGEIISMKLSPDSNILAVQRSPTQVELLPLSSTSTSSYDWLLQCKGRNSRIVGIEWTNVNELLLVTEHALELYYINCDKRNHKNTKLLNLSINWFVYSPQSHLLLASSGTLGTVLNPVVIKSGSFIRLPKFEVDFGLSPQIPKLSLLDRDVCIATIYGQLYVLVLRHSPRANVNGAEVLVYEINKDITLVARKVHHLQLGLTGRFGLHTLDNLIVVHHQMSKCSLVFDLKMGAVWDGFVNIHQPIVKEQFITLPVNISNDPDTSYDNQVELYAPSWVLFGPDIIIDAKVGCMWRLKLKLSPAVELISDKSQLLQFLLNRHKSKPLLLKLLSQSIAKRQLTLTLIKALFNIFTDVYYQHLNQTTAATSSEPFVCLPFAPVIIEQSDLYSNVFNPLMDGQQEHQSFLVDVLLQYLFALEQKRIEIQPYLQELLVCALVKEGNLQKLHQLLQYRIVTDSKPIAFLLLSLEVQYPAALQIALDMLARLPNASDEIIEVLLSKQKVIEALRYAESSGKLESMNPMKFVETAWQCDRHVRYTVFKHLQNRCYRINGTQRFAQGDKFEQYLYEFKRLYPELMDSEKDGFVVLSASQQ